MRWRRFCDKLIEGFGGGLVIVLVTSLGLLISSRYVINDMFHQAPHKEDLETQHCSPTGQQGQPALNCTVTVPCLEEHEVFVSGVCSVINGQFKADGTENCHPPIMLMNYGAESKSSDPSRFFCTWTSSKFCTDPQDSTKSIPLDFKPEVRVYCMKRNLIFPDWGDVVKTLIDALPGKP